MIFGLSLPAVAGLFGPSNFEECMSDGKIGRSTAEIYQLRKNCQKKFPKLLSIKNGTDIPVKCVFSGSTDVFSIQYSKKNNQAAMNGKPINLVIFTDEKIVLGGVKEPPIEINYLSGELSFSNSYGKCTEAVIN